MTRIEDINIVIIRKGRETYTFLFDDARSREILIQAGQYAADPDLSFTWYDAARVSAEVRRVTA